MKAYSKKAGSRGETAGRKQGIIGRFAQWFNRLVPLAALFALVMEE